MMDDRQIVAGPSGWSKWFPLMRKHQHICCNCLTVHDVRQKVDDECVIYESWKENKRATTKERKLWPKEKRQAWLKYFT
tara:strand:- start:190 stop:426 length:237 start_codon:yes stop_codon:yes gene_type:complete